MNFNTLTKTIKNKIESINKADQQKTLKINAIELIPEFEKMLAMDESVVKAITDSMKTEGFKAGHELHVWNNNGRLILIDGHTRRHCAIKAGLTSVPCIIHHFKNQEEAQKFAIREQTNRRNLSGEALLQAVANFDFTKGKGFTKSKGNADGEKGKTSEIIGKQLGVSSKTVEKARVVLKEATKEQKEAIRKDELSVNQVYNQLRKKEETEKSGKLSSKEKSFIAGIHYAIIRINEKKNLKDLYLETSSENFDFVKMTEVLKNTDLTTLFSEAKELTSNLIQNEV